MSIYVCACACLCVCLAGQFRHTHTHEQTHKHTQPEQTTRWTNNQRGRNGVRITCVDAFRTMLACTQFYPQHPPHCQLSPDLPHTTIERERERAHQFPHQCRLCINVRKTRHMHQMPVRCWFNSRAVMCVCVCWLGTHRASLA